MGSRTSNFYIGGGELSIRPRWILLIIAMSIAGNAFAVENMEARSLADMSVDERRAIMQLATRYDSCIYTQAMAKVGEFADIRHAADFAFGACRAQLLEVETGISAMGFGISYARAFANQTRNRAARKILPELAIRRAGG